jgi:hypothetical protein
MEKKTRTILFVIFVFLFFIISTSILLYTQGYRLDFKNKKLTKTGGLFLKIFPKQASIYLDNKFFKKTDFIFGSILIENLLPKKYKVRVEKEGYFPWEKNLEIKENEVTEVKNIILFPKKIKPENLFTKIENFWVSPGGKIILLEKENLLSFFDPKEGIKRELLKIEGDSQLLELWFSDDEKEIYLKLKAKEEVKTFSLNLEEIQPKLKEFIEEKLPIENVAFVKNGKEIYYLTDSGFLYKADEGLNFKTQINKNQFPIKKDKEYKLAIFENWLFLKEGDKLFYYNQDEDLFEKILDGVLDYKVSENGEKLAIFSSNEIFVLYLKERVIQPAKQKGEKIFITRFSEKIGNLFWLNPDYLIFNVGNKIKVSEVDDRDKFNIYDLGEFEKPKIFFNKIEKKLYILSEGNLISLNLPFL